MQPAPPTTRPGEQGVSEGKFHCFIWVSFDHQMRRGRGHRRDNHAGCKSHKTMWDTKYHRRVISIFHEQEIRDQGIPGESMIRNPEVC